jgi:hypothetical protein
MEASVQLNACAALPMWTEPPMTFEHEDVWALDSVSVFCRRGKSLAVAKQMNVLELRPNVFKAVIILKV